MAKLVIEVDLDGKEMPKAGQIHGQLKAMVEAVFSTIPMWADLHKVLALEPNGTVLAEAGNEGLEFSVARASILPDEYDATLVTRSKKAQVKFARATVRGNGKSVVTIHKTAEEAKAATSNNATTARKNAFYTA